MLTRFPWDSHEVALLINAYQKITSGADPNQVAVRLSQMLRELAGRNGRQINDTYRNVNGMKMQLANVQYLFTNGEKGLSGASAMIRQMVELYQTRQTEYQTILKEAIHMTGNTPTSVEDAFFAYAKEKTGLPPKMLANYLKKAADYCHLKQLLLGMTDVKAVRNVQQKVAEGKLLRFRFGKDAQSIRNATQLYYTFVKSYREPKEETALSSVPTHETPAENPDVSEASEAAPAVAMAISLNEFAASVDQVQEDEQSEEATTSEEVAPADSMAAQLTVDFSRNNSYLFTKPITYTYNGQTYPAKSWNRIYVEICGLLFDDHHDAFMSIMNGDIPGDNALAFADEQSYHRMRVPKSFAPGFYLESNLDATSIVRKLRGLHQLFGIGDDLQIVYQTVEDYQPSQSKEHREIGGANQLVADENYDWRRSDLLLVDLTKETSYSFTQPDAYEYKGVTRLVNKWGKLYADLCGLLFEDHHDAFIGIMNRDIPGYNSLAFADDQHKSGMRVARQFTPGYYLESNISATTIVRRIRGLYQLFSLGDNLRISYTKTGDAKPRVDSVDSGEEWIIHELRVRGLPFIDNRAVDGCLWIASDMSIPISLEDAATRGYHLHLKQDGCRAYPNRPVLWTKDQPKKPINTADFRRKLDENFKPYLLFVKKLAAPTAGQYSQSIEAVERFILERELGCTLDITEPDEAQHIYDMLFGRKDFVDWNNQRHHQYSAALAQYVGYLRQNDTTQPYRPKTIIETVCDVVRQAGKPLTITEIYQCILDGNLYEFGAENPRSVVLTVVYRFCTKTRERIEEGKEVLIQTEENGQKKYQIMNADQAAVFLGYKAKETEPISKTGYEIAAFFGRYYGDTPAQALTSFIYGLSAHTHQEPKPGMIPKGEIGAASAVMYAKYACQKMGVIETPTMQEVPVRIVSEKCDPVDASPWQKYQTVLQQAFTKGFQKESGLDMKKLRKRWSEIHGEDLKDTDDIVRQQLAAHCIDTGKRWYLAELLLSEEDRQSVLNYIDRILSSGKSVLFYSSIYAALEHELASTVLTEDLLVSYLQATCRGQYILRENYLTNDRKAQVDLAEEIKNVMLAHGRPIHTDDLKRALHHFPPDQVEKELHIHREFIMDAFHVYFHESMADLTAEELDQIASFIQEELDDQGYMIGDWIQCKLQRLYPETAERLSFLTLLGVREAVAYKLRDRFNFSGPVITPKGQAMNMIDVFAMYCKRHAPFTLDELTDFAKECDSTIYMDTVHRNCLRISKEEFVPNGSVRWNIPHADAAIALHCPGKYVSLKSIQHFDAFPFVGYPWNSYLLEQYVATVSKDFILMHSSYAKNTTSGSIVRRNAGFESFDDVLADVLANAAVVMEKAPCLEYLANEGYITRKKLSNIVEIITRAKVLRSQKG